MITTMKRRVTVSLKPALLKALDRAPGASRSQKIERLLQEALAVRAHRQWVAELRAFYETDAARAEHKEEAAWHALVPEALERDA